MKRRNCLVVASACMALLAGCRRADVRSMSLTLEDMNPARQRGVEQVLSRLPGVVECAWRTSDGGTAVDVRYDSLHLAEMNVRHALAASGFHEKLSAKLSPAEEAGQTPSPVSPRHVYLKNRGLTDLKGDLYRKAVGEAKDIVYMNLDYNHLSDVSEIAGQTGLKWLRLNGNRLTGLPDLRPLANLRRIYLRDNNLSKVPDTLADLPRLTDIDISGNPIDEVPEWLARRQGLENLAFNGTRITKLPDDLSAWRSLKSLQLGGLRLSDAEMRRVRAALSSPDSPGRTVVVF